MRHIRDMRTLIIGIIAMVGINIFLMPDDMAWWQVVAFFIFSGAVGWVSGDIDDWLAERRKSKRGKA